MFGWLLTKPAVILDVFLLGILLVFGGYTWYSHHELGVLQTKITEQNIQLKQNETTIKDLNTRLELVQKLNDNFNKAVNDIRAQQAITAKALTDFNLRSKATQNPKQAEQFLNNRTNSLFDNLNTITRPVLGNN